MTILLLIFLYLLVGWYLWQTTARPETMRMIPYILLWLPALVIGLVVSKMSRE